MFALDLATFDASSGPEDPTLVEAEAALERGDYRRARELARQAQTQDPPETQRPHIERILAATGFDPAAVVVAVSSAFLLVVVTVMAL